MNVMYDHDVHYITDFAVWMALRYNSVTAICGVTQKRVCHLESHNVQSSHDLPQKNNSVRDITCQLSSVYCLFLYLD